MAKASFFHWGPATREPARALSSVSCTALLTAEARHFLLVVGMMVAVSAFERSDTHAEVFRNLAHGEPLQHHPRACGMPHDVQPVVLASELCRHLRRGP
jgi:hypothetical protein